MDRVKNRWIVQFTNNSNARSRLFCFAHAGGGSLAFRKWADELPTSVQLCAIRLPGRESRMSEAHVTSWPELVSQIVAALPTDLPFAFFGHSLGAMIAYEVTQALQQCNMPTPYKLFVSGRSAPHLPVLSEKIAHLTDDDFVVALQARYGAIPTIIRDEPKLLQLFLPIMRADFTLVETHRYHAVAPLACPIVAFGGADDYVTEDRLMAWAGLTSADFHHHIFPGGHFYLEEQRTALLETLSRYLHHS